MDISLLLGDDMKVDLGVLQERNMVQSNVACRILHIVYLSYMHRQCKNLHYFYIVNAQNLKSFNELFFLVYQCQIIRN